jgi:hypothetical protein
MDRDRPHFYCLNEDGSVAPLSFEEYFDAASKRSEKQRRIGLTNVGFIVVSTVFLTIDHAWEGPPILFETMLFPRWSSVHAGDWMWRYETIEEARAGHDRACLHAFINWKAQLSGLYHFARYVLTGKLRCNCERGYYCPEKTQHCELCEAEMPREN